MSPGLLRRVPAGQRVARGYITGNLSSYYQPYFSFPQFGKSYGTPAPVGLVGTTRLAFPDLADGLAQVAVPFHCVHAKVKVGVYGEHRKEGK
jgi:hypothetical protein